MKMCKILDTFVCKYLEKKTKPGSHLRTHLPFLAHIAILVAGRSDYQTSLIIDFTKFFHFYTYTLASARLIAFLAWWRVSATHAGVYLIFGVGELGREKETIEYFIENV